MMSGTLEDAIRQLAHQRLTVGSTFTRDDQQGIAQQVVEVYCIQEDVDAGSAGGIHILQECIAQATCSSSPGHILAVMSEMAGRAFSKASGTSIKTGNHVRRGPLLRSEYTGSPIGATERIGYIGGNGKVHLVESVDVVPVAMRGKIVYQGPEHADAAIAGGTAAQPVP